MKIFIVDDDQFSLFYTRYKLIAEGLSDDIETFQFPEEAFQLLISGSADHIPDIILLDLNMPVMDGWQFLEALAPYWPNIRKKCRIYVLTSSLDAADEVKAKENPMVTAFFDKPIHAEDVEIILLQK